jgi:hypothetical protein
MYKSIYEVIGRMQANLNYINVVRHLHAQKPFLQTYKMVTEQVLLHHDLTPHYFDDFATIEKLDIAFAELYFVPWEKVRDHHRVAAPWKAYYAYTGQVVGSAFLQVLLGINAHINADLANALYELDYRHEEDYKRINEVLCEVLPDLMRFLFVEEHDVVGLAGILMRKFFVYELRNIIVTWREEAWRHAELLRSGAITIDELNAATDHLNEKMISWWRKYFNFWHLPKLLWLLNNKAKVRLLAK